MKNKMILTALAVAMAAPGVAIADGHKGVKFTGIVQQHLFVDQADENKGDENEASINGGDVRLQLMASEEVGGLTGYGQYRLDAEPGTSNSTVSSDNVRVGVKGSFGNVQIGESMEVDFGEYANDINTAQSISNAAIAYSGSFGPISVETLFSPKGNDDEFAIGVQGKFGPVTVGASTGTQKTSIDAAAAVAATQLPVLDAAGNPTGETVAAPGTGSAAVEEHEDKTTVSIIGAKASLGPVTLAAHTWTNKFDDGAAADQDNESEGYAVKVSGNVAAWSWGLTYDVKDTTKANGADVDKGGETVTRLDLGTKYAGLNLGIRYNTKSYEASGPGTDTEDFLRLSAAKKF